MYNFDGPLFTGFFTFVEGHRGGWMRRRNSKPMTKLLLLRKGPGRVGVEF